MKKVVVISTSLRAGSNSQVLAEQFAEGAKTAGHQMELREIPGLTRRQDHHPLRADGLT